MAMTTPGQPLAGRRALVVEDEYLIAKKLERYSQEHGARILVSLGRSRQAEEQVTTADFNVAALNIDLQGQIIFRLPKCAKGGVFRFCCIARGL